MKAQSTGDFEDRCNARAALHALDEAYVVPIEAGEIGQFFLTYAFGVAMAANFLPQRYQVFVFAILRHGANVALPSKAHYLPLVRTHFESHASVADSSSQNQNPPIRRRGRRIRSAAFDRRLGGRIRDMRRFFGLSQAELGGFIGVTAQQMQKYEAGTNQISAATLYVLCQALSMRMGQVFEDFPSPPLPWQGPAAGGTEASLPVPRHEARTYLTLLARIPDGSKRRSVLNLLRAMVEDA